MANEKDKKKAPEKKETTEEIVVPEVKEEVKDPVVVSREDLEGFMNRLNTLEATNKRLIAVADKGRLANEREKEVAADGTPLIHTVRLTQLEQNGQVVVAWKLTDNESYVDGNRMVEKQEIDIVYKDGSLDHMRLIDFYRKQLKVVVADIIGRTVNQKTRETELELELKDGERITMPIKFVN